MLNKSQFLQVAIKAAKEAEKIIMKYYAGNISWQTKSDRSPVTRADKGAEKAIIKTIKKYFPDHGFIGEEFGMDNESSEYQWIIDPIDGTKNYTRHVPLFGTQIALAHKGEIFVGVSNALALKELVYAEKGKGAYCNHKKIKVSPTKKLIEAYLNFGGLQAFVKENKLKSLLNLTANVQEPRGIGDFWCYHLLAQGKIDIMIEARTSIWDIAAVKIIVEEAGGRITDMTGNEINVSQSKMSFLATNGWLHQTVLNLIKS